LIDHVFVENCYLVAKQKLRMMDNSKQGKENKDHGALNFLLLMTEK